LREHKIKEDKYKKRKKFENIDYNQKLEVDKEKGQYAEKS